MHVVDRFDVGMLLHGDGVESAHLAHLHEGRLQGGQRLHGGRGTHVLVLGQNRQAVGIAHRQHRILEAALVPGAGGALLALDRVGVDVVAREAVFGGDQVGGNALRQEISGDRDRGVDRPGAAGGADADAAHRFGAAADGHLMLPGHDLGGGEIHRVEPRGAEAIDLDAGHAVAEAGHQRRGAGDVAAGLAHRIDAAKHHVVDHAGVELVALLDGAERLRGEIERGHLVQRAVGLAAAARGAHGVVDECVGHGVLLVIPGRVRSTRARNPETNSKRFIVALDSGFTASQVGYSRLGHLSCRSRV